MEKSVTPLTNEQIDTMMLVRSHVLALNKFVSELAESGVSVRFMVVDANDRDARHSVLSTTMTRAVRQEV